MASRSRRHVDVVLACILVWLCVVLTCSPGAVTPAHAAINLLGVIYGASGSYCDAFYWSRPRCQNKTECLIPLNQSTCLHYGLPSPERVNVMHANWECSEDWTFRSSNLVQTPDDGGAEQFLHIRCPSATTAAASAMRPTDASPGPASVQVAKMPSQPRLARVHGVQLQQVASRGATPAPGLTILGVVIGSQGVYCDAYFHTAALCRGLRACPILMSDALCSLGLPNPNTAQNFMHVMYACDGVGFNRVAVRQSAGSFTLACPPLSAPSSADCTPRVVVTAVVACLLSATGGGALSWYLLRRRSSGSDSGDMDRALLA